MAVLTWDKTGMRIYQTGVDRGVIYLWDGTFAPWNGLTSVEDSSVSDLKSFYLDGVKYLDNLTPGDFSGKLKAFTYPDELDKVMGVVDVAPGLSYHDQPGQSFNLTYRTRVGNDLEGVDHGYKIHLLYNLVANPDAMTYETLKEQANPSEFSWSLTGTPPKITGNRPTVHISIDSRHTLPGIVKAIEDALYGTETTSPHFPTINEIATYFNYIGALIIIDNGDGSWTAIDEGDNYITMLSETEFQIDNADADFLDASTYTITTTTP